MKLQSWGIEKMETHHDETVNSLVEAREVGGMPCCSQMWQSEVWEAVPEKDDADDRSPCRKGVGFGNSYNQGYRFRMGTEGRGKNRTADVAAVVKEY
jgi:hypothetical protein